MRSPAAASAAKLRFAASAASGPRAANLPHYRPSRELASISVCRGRRAEASRHARTSIVPEIRGPRTQSAAEAAKRSFAAEAAAGDLMVDEDGPRCEPEEREKVAELRC